jgi:hypothetical protein
MNLARQTALTLELVFAYCLLAVVGVAAQNAPTGELSGPLWVDEKWPFPIDQWGTGHAFGCAADQCAHEIHLYLRAKIGFCRCATGVSDDDEIDRVGDVELIGADYKPLAPGHAIAAGIMTGRSRLFEVDHPLQSPTTVLTIVLAHKCDAIVATVPTEPGVKSELEGQVLEFLRSAAVQQWVDGQSGPK